MSTPVPGGTTIESNCTTVSYPADIDPISVESKYESAVILKKAYCVSTDACDPIFVM